MNILSQQRIQFRAGDPFSVRCGEKTERKSLLYLAERSGSASSQHCAVTQRRNEPARTTSRVAFKGQAQASSTLHCTQPLSLHTITHRCRVAAMGLAIMPEGWDARVRYALAGIAVAHYVASACWFYRRRTSAVISGRSIAVSLGTAVRCVCVLSSV